MSSNSGRRNRVPHRTARTLLTGALACLLAGFGAGVGAPALAAAPAPKKIAGTGSVVGAPTLAPGRWVDNYGGDTPAVKHYVIDRRYQGSTLVVTAAVPAGTGYDTARVSFEKPDGSSCYAFSASGVEKAAGVATASGTSGPVSSSGVDPTSGCTDQDRLLVTVEGPDAVPAQPAPMQLTVTEIPAAQGAAALPQLPDTLRWQSPPTDSQGVRTTGGTGDAAGPVLTTGSYESTITAGQTLSFRVRAGWGQSISTTTSLSAEVPSGGENPTLATAILGPNGASADVNVSDGPSASRNVYSGATIQAGAQSAPVLYRNLAEGRAFGASQPGTYTIHVSLSESAELTAPIPFLLQIGVNDGPTSVPQFAQGEQIDTGGYDDPVVAVGQTGGAEGTPSTGGASEDPSGERTAAGERGDSGDAGQDADRGGLFGLPTWAVVAALGLAGLVAIVAAVLVILASRAPGRR